MPRLRRVEAGRLQRTVERRGDDEVLGPAGPRKRNKKELGELYNRLFEETDVKVRPNAEEMIPNLFLELGITREAADATMDNLREVKPP